MISIGFSRVPLKRSLRVIIKDLEGYCTIGAQIITNTIVAIPYYRYRIMGPKAPF